MAVLGRHAYPPLSSLADASAHTTTYSYNHRGSPIFTARALLIHSLTFRVLQTSAQNITMPSSTMRTAVFQATALFILSMICSHHLSENMFDQVLENERFLNMTNALNRSASLDSTNNTPGGLTLGAGDTTNKTLSFNHTIDHNNGTGINGTFSALLSNGTLINGTFSATNGSPGSAESAESFYGRRLPREVVIFMVISALQYWWFIWLERTLPARPRHREYQREEKVEESEDREEEVVKKWIAQGRVHRASLNWCNTLLKWLLELTVGRLWYHTVEHVLRVLLKFQSPKTVLEDLISVSHPSPTTLAPGLIKKQASHPQFHPLHHTSC